MIVRYWGKWSLENIYKWRQKSYHPLIMFEVKINSNVCVNNAYSGLFFRWLKITWIELNRSLKTMNKFKNEHNCSDNKRKNTVIVQQVFHSGLHSVHITCIWKILLVQLNKQSLILNVSWLAFQPRGIPSCQSCKLLKNLVFSATSLNMTTWANGNRMEPWVQIWTFFFTNQGNTDKITPCCPFLYPPHGECGD